MVLNEYLTCIEEVLNKIYNHFFVLRQLFFYDSYRVARSSYTSGTFATVNTDVREQNSRFFVGLKGF